MEQCLKLLEQFPTFIWRCGKDARPDYFNAAWLDFTGRDPLRETDCWEAIDPEDREKRASAFREAFERRTPFRAEYRLRRRDGSYGWISEHGFPYHDAKGSFAGYLGNCLDISAHQAHLPGEGTDCRGPGLFGAKLELVLERMPMPCMLMDRHFTVTFWNDAAQRVFGFSREETIGKTPYQFLIPEAEEAGIRSIEAAIRAKDILVPGPYRNLTREGDTIVCEWYHTTLRDRKGEATGFICTAVDIGSRLKSEEALKRSEQIQHLLNADLTRTLVVVEEALSARIESEAALLKSEGELKKLNSELRGILDAVEERIILFSRELEVVWSNRGASLQREEKGDAGTDKTAAGDSAASYIREALESGGRYSGQTAVGGRIFDVQVYPIIGEHQEVQSVLEVSRDVTRVVHQQAQAVHTAHLASLGELAAGVAHEINNPTHGIINYAEHLSRKFPEEGRVQDICSRIVRESERIAGIVKALLDFSRTRDGEKTRVRMDEVVGEALTLCRSQLRRDNIRVFLDRADQPLPEVLADPQQLVQVLLNVISNARYALNQKFPEIDSNKSVTFSLSTTEGGCAAVAIRDEGGGIPEHLLPKVLNPFFSTKPNGHGTGLGLSISNTIITEHGGRLEIASTPGSSTTVTILLPAWSANAA